GMVGGQFWSVYVPAGAMEDGNAARIQLEQIDIARRIIEAHPETFELATSPADVTRIFSEGRIASMLGMEGGHAIENSLGALRAFHDLGVRYMTLTHSANIDWADSCCEPPELDGLSPFGEEVVREMNRLGMLVDISHVSPATMHDVLDITQAPVIFSHSSAYSVTDHPRNVPDEVLRRMADNGGVVMVTYVTVFVSQALKDWRDTPAEERTGEAPEATMDDVIEHIEHVRDVAGIDHVGIGSDYDGATMPRGLEDVSTFPALLAELSRRGWTEEELRKLAGENVLRAWRGAEQVGRRLRAQRPASTATLAELDGLITAGDGAFVTRLGDDTLAVERFRFTPAGFEVMAAIRVPRTELVRYRGELNREGDLESLLVLEYDPVNPPSAGGQPTGGAQFSFGPDGVVVEGQSDRGDFRFDVETGPTAIPFFETIHWPFELALMRRAAGAGGDTVPMITGRRAMPFEITRMGPGRMQIRHPFRGTMEVAVTEEGRIHTLDASGTTRKLQVERVADVDVIALAREYARRDEAGRGIGALSGRGEAVGEVDGVGIVVDYGVPRKRGREIFGELVPFGEVWRTGANRATHATTDADLVVGGEALPAGTYTLFTIPGPEKWTLIISSATDINGTSYDPAADFARVTMDVRALDDPVEDFTIVVDPDGYLRMRWDRTEAYVPIRAR
ncbi:MAG: membrane dipeptidase, partial [Longimicrobiales bacterium]|nr:membrane dipeptidase [Longimicrobiales bacterium]